MKRTPRIDRLTPVPALPASPANDAHAQPPIARPRRAELLALLLGHGAESIELPSLTDLVTTVIALAEGKRRKVILPLSSSTGEFALVRRAEQVLLCYYDSGPVPQIFVRDRAIDLAALIGACGAAAKEAAELYPASQGERPGIVLAERILRTQIKPDRTPNLLTVSKRGGAQGERADMPLCFGFAARIPTGDVLLAESGARADVHALLFDGELWGFVHGRRIMLARGPVFPAIARMVSAARSVVDAWESQRPLHLKLKAGDFGIGLRLSREGELAVSLAGVGGDSVNTPTLDVPSALLPILKLAGELVRCVVSADRAQARNLRLGALRDEVRALRRIVRTRAAQKSFTNRDAELLRASSSGSTGSPADRPSIGLAGLENPGKLRLSLRWQAEVDGLDASSTFLCGDRLVVATPRSQLALSRENGELLWARQMNASATLMAGTSLLCVSSEGDVALCDLDDGEAYARTRIAPRVGGQISGLFAGGRNAPPVAVITEGRDRLVALDVRTGEPRWRFRSPGRGGFRFTRAGRILLVVSGDSTLDAIDVATGDVVWRWSDAGRMTLPPVITREYAIAVSGAPGCSPGALLCFDLFSGKLRFRRELSSAPLTSPVATDSMVVVSTYQNQALTLSAFDLETGQERWSKEDPGLGEGGAPLVVDQQLVLNTQLGVAYGLSLADGSVSWSHRMADPLRDDVPRRLEPVLRGGALFLPSASVHVLRPHDGSVVGGTLSEGIIPDFLRVDERGWMYLAEESGHIEAYAPAPNLRLVKAV
ncbi:MAG: PQQ-like beta-propeller repeat protein [Myxococcales bacterium]